MEPSSRFRPTRITFALAASVVGLVAAFTVAPDAHSRSLLADAALAWTGLFAGRLVARGEHPGWSRRSGWYLGLGLYGLAAVNAVLFLRELGGPVTFGPSVTDVGFLFVGLAFLAPILIEFSDHFPREDRREIGADVALLTVAAASVAYIVLLPQNADGWGALSAAVFAIIASAAITTYGALALWVPTGAHIVRFVMLATMAGATFGVGYRWVRGTYQTGHVALGLATGLAVLGLAAVVVLLPDRMRKSTSATPTRWGRPLLTATSVAAACAALAVVAQRRTSGAVGAVEPSVMIAILATAVALRILVNQIRSADAARQVHAALDQKELALAETDRALERLRRANETLRESEERLRTVFEAAVDGIVELDDRDVVLQANEAFSQMVDLPRTTLEGQPWAAIAAAAHDADGSFTTLPSTGEGTLRREGRDLYVEARTSDIPGDPPRRLLLVRDVTAARVADQTIRSLFKFLQDRDEDRSKILRRTNAAIETERNRIARDLHDGPVQGVSAASLSLEAVLLMLKAGDVQEGLSVLAKVRRELSEEADNLRKLMSGLRPPLLEERGLIPAIRETLERFGVDNDMATEFHTDAPPDLPADVETLAFRIVQEALSNAGKHSRATRVTVSVEIVAGQLRVEVTDDGVGFDPTRSRDFLQMGRVGLASMRERVELANGTFMVQATPGKGSTILVTLSLEGSRPQQEFAVG